MKRDMDLIRDILIKMESMDFDRKISVDNFVSDSHDGKEVSEHIKMLLDVDFIEADEIPATNQTYSQFLIKRITMYGYDFLDDIRSDDIWGKTKNVAEKIGTRSLSGISKIASNIISEIIKSQLGLT